MTDDDRGDEMPRPSGNGLSLRGPGGLSLSASGPVVVVILVLLVGFASLGYISQRGFEGVSLALAELVRQGSDDRTERLREHYAIQNAQNELACVLALSVEDRAAALNDPQGICHYARTFYRLERKR